MRSSNRRGAALAVCVLLASIFPLTSAGAVAGFGDVAGGAFYAAPVQWLSDAGITTGTSAGCFSPERSVTRGEFATFVWRGAGKPGDGTEPFTDVDRNDFFATAVAWMSNQGITTGTTPTTFEPDRPVTRGETATFLWRRAGEPPISVRAGGSCNAPAPRPTPTTTTTAPPTPTTTAPGGSGSSYFSTLAPGATLPTGEWCAAHIKPAAETRPGNTVYNNTRGNSANDRPPASIYGRVDGYFTGTTDEIIQWAACKWGIDENIARAQAAKESYWDMTAGGDRTTDQNRCHPDLRTNGPDCPESIGLLQVRWLYHTEAFENSNSIRSTAYNADYTYAVWRDCYNGNLTWLGNGYTAGDLQGCLGVWFSGRWYTPEAIGYINTVNDYNNQQIWTTPAFLNYR